jgi:peptide-methionine (R)-S-oxide reductase
MGGPFTASQFHPCGTDGRPTVLAAMLTSGSVETRTRRLPGGAATRGSGHDAIALCHLALTFPASQDHQRTGGPAMDTKQYPVTHTEAEWHKLLTPEQFRIMRGHGTEPPGSCALNHEKRAGTFSCAGCGQPLFASKQKFESGTGWPSFNDQAAGAVETSADRSYGMVRTEVHCSGCGSHLGHVFEDGPPPTHLRYCINGVVMNFKPD